MLVARLYLLNDSFAHQLISGSLVILKTMVGLSKVRCYCLRLYLLNASFSHILIADCDLESSFGFASAFTLSSHIHE